MGFKLPFLSKDKDDSFGSDADVSVLDAPEHKADDASASAREGKSPDFTSTLNPNPNATLIGDVLQRSGGIRLPIIGKLPLQEQVRILLIAFTAIFLLAIGFAVLNANYSTLVSTQTQIAGDALMHSQRIGKAAPNAVQGNVEAFDQLDDSRKLFNSDLKVLMEGGVYQARDIDAPNSQMAAQLKGVRATWDPTDLAAATILKRKAELTGFGATLQRMNTLSPVLLDLTQQISSQKLQSG